MADWLLGIDESGRVADPSSSALLGGVLVNARDTPAFRRELRGALALPGAPWPPHATALRHPSAWAVYAARGAEGASPTARAAAEALGLTRTARDDHDALVDLDRRLVATPEGGRLRAACREARLHFGDGLGRLRGLGSGGAWVVAAWADAPAVDHGLDRYTRLLAALAERVEWLLEGVPGAAAARPHSVAVHAARFTIEGGATALRTFAAIGRRKGPVTWVPFAPEAYHRDDTHPIVVAADFACNALRRALGDVPWADVAREVQLQTRLAPAGAARPATGPLPAIASLGLPADVLAGRESGAALVGHRPRWAADQARAWLGAREAR